MIPLASVLVEFPRSVRAQSRHDGGLTEAIIFRIPFILLARAISIGDRAGRSHL